MKNDEIKEPSLNDIDDYKNKLSKEKMKNIGFSFIVLFIIILLIKFI